MPDKANVLSLVMPPLVMLVTAPVSVPTVLLMVERLTAMSTVPVMAPVVVVLPAASVTFAVRLCAPAPKTGVVYVQPVPVNVALPR